MVRNIVAALVAVLVVGSLILVIRYDHENWARAAPSIAVWTPVAKSGPFGIRDSASSLTFGGKLVLSGGFRASDRPAYRDVWSSPDGADWTLEEAQAPIDDYAALVSDGQRILAIGSTVWRTDGDLASWIKISDNGPNSLGSTGYAFWLSDQIVYVGPGFVARSVDEGVSWEQYTPPFAPRAHHSATMHKGKIFVVAGADETRPNTNQGVYYPGTTALDDVWSSSDGLSWELVNPEAPFSRRMWPALVSSGEYLILAHGFSNRDRMNLDDVWISKDGVEWEEMDLIQPPDQRPLPRHFPSSYALDDGGILVVAGNAWPVQNDAWRLDFW
jgi:hypothetical protein